MEWERAGESEGAGTSTGGGVPKPKKNKGKIVALVIVVLIVLFAVSRCNSDENKNLDWPITGLATVLPEPSSKKGEVTYNSDTSFSANLYKCSSSDYSDYVDACKEKGFTVDAETDTTSYTAYNEEGYKLRLLYYESEEEISIGLDAPTEMSDITWPTSGPGALLPAPPSTRGSVLQDSSDTYTVLVGDMDKDAFSAYVDQCKNAGFTVDYNSGDTFYSASNADGVKLRIDYQGFNTVRISADASEASSTSTTTSSSDSSASTSSTDASLVTPEFKEMMDSYEEFMNQYCDFMEKYENADAADQAEMLADYNSMLQQEADWAQKLDEVDENTLSAADYAYYLEVTGRVEQRLLEIGQ